MLNLSKEQIHTILGLYNNGQFQEAIDAIELLNLDYPNVPLLFNLLGACYKSLGQIDNSLQMFETAIKIKPDYAEAYFNKGVILKGIDRLEEAVECYKKAIDLVPNYPDAHNNLGNAFKALGSLEAAIESYENAITFNPNLAHFHYNLGIVYKDFGRMEDAIKSFQNAISINPKLYDVQNNLAIALRKVKRFNEALVCYERANELRPDTNYNLTNIFHLKMHLCIWDGLSNQLKELEKKINNRKKVIRPFALLGLIDDPDLQMKTSLIYCNDKYLKSNELGQIKNYSTHSKIRVGYFSADFRDHPVAALTIELYEIHNRAQFEVYAFSYGPDTKDEMNMRIKEGVDYFYNVETMSDKKLALFARSLEIDIAVDLGGFTQNSRTGVFAMSVAPIQISYLGYLGTMGADYYDYIIADAIIIPEKSKKYYTEKIAYLPNFQMNDSKQSYEDIVLTRVELGIPEDSFVFCCFNNTYKITPFILDSWAFILKNVESSILLIYAENELAKINLLKEISNRGIDSLRLFFGIQLPRPEYLGRYKVVDLFLDTHPYNAGATASDALRMGLPVLTYVGNSFASRMGASILTAMNLPELITYTQEEYELLAIKLATNPEKLKIIKDKLINNLPNAPLYDSSLFAKHLESAYQTMYEKYQQGIEANHIYVQNSN